MGTSLSGFESLSGGEWQDLCIRVLHEHHGGGELVEVPDDDRGDAGLEAFSLDGCAYQCYAPENEPLTASQRFTKQRKKIKDDVAKFVKNGEKLKKLLPSKLLIRRWILLVPRITTKRLHELAAELTEEIRSAQLPYVAENIMAVAQTLRAYEAAKHAVVARQLHVLELPPLEEPDFSGLDDPLIEVMRKKLAKTVGFRIPGSRDALISRLLANFVAGRAHRDWVRDQYSELGDELEERLEDLEARLAMQYPLNDPEADQLLASVLADTESTVRGVLNTRASQSRVISEGQVADWLMRCPLDFP